MLAQVAEVSGLFQVALYYITTYTANLNETNWEAIIKFDTRYNTKLCVSTFSIYTLAFHMVSLMRNSCQYARFS